MPHAVRVNGAWIRVRGAFSISKVAPFAVAGGPVDPGKPNGEQLPVTYVDKLQTFNFAANWLEDSSDEDKAYWGVGTYTAVGDPPSGQRSLGKVLVDDNGSPKEVHQLEDIPLEERKAAMLTAADARRDECQQSDFTYDFGEIEALDDAGQSIPAGERALQMRYDPDQRNWQALQSQAVLAVMAGQGTTVMPMRAEDNWNVQTTASDVLAATTAMFLRNAAILFHGGALKSQIRAAGSGSALDAINITTGWPV